MAITGSSDKKKVRVNFSKEGIYFWIDSYDDIFSDFDYRPYSKRATSADFLEEAKRASVDKEDKINLQLYVPIEKREVQDEKAIKERLHEHFKKHHHLLKKESKQIRNKGFYFIFFGLVMMMSAAFVLFKYHLNSSLLVNVMVVFLEPGGWFLFWEGLDLILFESKANYEDLNFYRKMSNSTIQFFSD